MKCLNLSIDYFDKDFTRRVCYPIGKKESIITKVGWNDTLGGKAPRCYECASFEASGENNERARADWAKVLRPGDAFIVDRMSTFEEQYGEKVFVKNA